MLRYQFCPHCGEKYAPSEGSRHDCARCGKTVFLVSQATSSVIITDGEKILLSKRAIEPKKGMWDIIGGFQRYGEHPHAAAIREVKEETGLDVEVTGYVGSFMDVYGPDKEATLNMCFTVNVVGGVMTPQDDVEELRWFSLEDIPELAFENGKNMVEAWTLGGRRI